MNRTELEVGGDWYNSRSHIDCWGDSIFNINQGISFIPAVYGLLRQIPASKTMRGHNIGLNTGNSMPGGSTNIQVSGGQNSQFTTGSQAPINPATAMRQFVGLPTDFMIPGERCEWTVKSGGALSSFGDVYNITIKDLAYFCPNGDWYTGKSCRLGIPFLMGPPNCGAINGLSFADMDDFNADATYAVNNDLGNKSFAGEVVNSNPLFKCIESLIPTWTNDNVALRFRGYSPNGTFNQEGMTIAFTYPYIYRTDVPQDKGIWIGANGWGGATIKNFVEKYSTKSIEAWRNRGPCVADTALLMMGMNESTDEAADSRSVWKAYVAEFCRRLSGAGYNKIILCPCYQVAGDSAKKIQQRLRMSELRSEFGYAMLDVQTVLGDYSANTADGIHLNQTGADGWGTAVINVLNAWGTAWKARVAP